MPNKTLTIAEFIRRFGEECLVYPYGDEEKKQCAAIAGHWLYVHKDKPPRIVFDTERGEIEIFRPEKSEDLCYWFKVVAKGFRSGKPRLWNKAKRKDNDAWLNVPDVISIGDTILVPHNHPWGVVHSAVDQHELLIDPQIVLAKVEE